ncbi:MAG: hypothetical protein ABI808_03625 [Pseudonocardiales bacterium]
MQLADRRESLAEMTVPAQDTRQFTFPVPLLTPASDVPRCLAVVMGNVPAFITIVGYGL